MSFDVIYEKKGNQENITSQIQLPLVYYKQLTLLSLRLNMEINDVLIMALDNFFRDIATN